MQIRIAFPSSLPPVCIIRYQTATYNLGMSHPLSKQVTVGTPEGTESRLIAGTSHPQNRSSRGRIQSHGNMTTEKGPAAGDATLRRRIEPWDFQNFFDPRDLRKETCLLYEINWGGRHSVWRHTGKNTSNHVEVNFIKKFTSERYYSPSAKCSITWFLSWSPCWECSKAIIEFLSQHRNVTLFIYVARLFQHLDPRNRKGIRDLINSGVTVRIMTEPEYCYCWRYFVNYQAGSEAFWPRYPRLWMMLYVLELQCIILGLPSCVKIIRRCQNQVTFFTLNLQNCHYQMIPPHILLATGLI